MSKLPQLPPLPQGGKKGKGKKETPAQRAANAAAYQQAKAQNPYFQGQAYLEKKQELSTIWEAYTGRPINDAQARRVIGLGWSNYHLQVYLSGQKSFVGSPVWKTNAPSAIQAYKQMFGQTAKPKQSLVAYAIIHNLGAASFQDYLRNQTGLYVKSVEFKNTAATLQNVYAQIIGNPNQDQAQADIKKAALAGWTQDQFAKYLRNSPLWSTSDEAHQTITTLASAFGGTVPSYNQNAQSPEQGGPPPNQQQQQQQGVNNG